MEDSEEKTAPVAHVLRNSGVSYAHLNSKETRTSSCKPFVVGSVGVFSLSLFPPLPPLPPSLDAPAQFKANTQRNMGIKFIQVMEPQPNLASVAYFAGAAHRPGLCHPRCRLCCYLISLVRARSFPCRR